MYGTSRACIRTTLQINPFDSFQPPTILPLLPHPPTLSLHIPLSVFRTFKLKVPRSRRVRDFPSMHPYDLSDTPVRAFPTSRHPTPPTPAPFPTFPTLPYLPLSDPSGDWLCAMGCRDGRGLRNSIRLRRSPPQLEIKMSRSSRVQEELDLEQAIEDGLKKTLRFPDLQDNVTC